MDPLRQRQLDLEAEAEAEALYIFNQRNKNNLGADYNRSLGGQVPEATRELLPALNQFFNPLADNGRGGPYDSLFGEHLNTEQKVGNAGMLAGAGAGASLGASTGATIGAMTGPFAPVGIPLGMLVGGASGAALGMAGFDFAKDAALQSAGRFTGENYGHIRPIDEYAKDVVYNTTQGALGGFLGKTGWNVAKAPFKAPAVANKFINKLSGPEATDAKVAAYLEERAPGYKDALESQYTKLAEQGVPQEFIDRRSLGEILQNPTLLAEERALAKSGSSEFGRVADARMNRNDTQLKFLDRIEPEYPEASAADAQLALADIVEGELAAKQKAVDLAKGEVGQALAEVPTEIDQAYAGEIGRGAVTRGIASHRGTVTQHFNDIGDGAVSMKIPRSMIAQEKSKYFKDVGATPNPELVTLIEQLDLEGEPMTGADLVPGVKPKAFVDQYGDPIVKEKTYTMQDLRVLRSKASEIQNKADAKSAAIAGKIIESLDMAVEEAVKSGSVTEKQANAFKSAISARKEQGRIYEGTPAGKVLDTKASGDYSAVDSSVMPRFFRSGKKNGAREAVVNYIESTGGDVEALNALDQYAATSFRSAAVDGATGKVDAGRAKRWLAQHEEALTAMPVLRERLSTVAKAQELMDEKFGDLQKTQAETEKGALKLFLNRSDGLMIDPDVAMAKILTSSDAVRNLKATTQYIKSKGDRVALAGLRRSVADFIKNRVFRDTGEVSASDAGAGRTFDGKMKDAKLLETWDKLRPAITKSGLFTDSQIKMYETLYKEKASQMSVNEATFPGSDTAPTQNVLTNMLESTAGRWVKSKLGYKWDTIVEPVLLKIPRYRFRERLHEVILNPRIARDLNNKPTPANMTKTAMEIFKEEFSQFSSPLFSKESLKRDAASMAKTVLPTSPYAMAVNDRPKKKLTYPKQQAITARESFPTQEKLLAPPAPSLKKKSFNLKEFIAEQPEEVRNRIHAESTNNPMAISPKGAQGLSQLMPDTGKWIAKQLGEKYIPLTANMTPEQQEESIKQNVRFGTWYYEYLLGKFDNIPELAWAAYNAGPANVNKAIKRAGTSTNVKEIFKYLPKPEETIPYVKKLVKKNGRN